MIIEWCRKRWPEASFLGDVEMLIYAEERLILLQACDDLTADEKDAVDMLPQIRELLQ